MTEQSPRPDAAPHLEQLIDEWLTVPDLAEALDLPLRQVRRLIDERQVLAHRVGERRVQSVPAKFVQDGELLGALPGTITVLHDAGLSDVETLTWLFTPDETLPVPGCPVDMLRAGHKAEVRRRAQEMAF